MRKLGVGVCRSASALAVGAGSLGVRSTGTGNQREVRPLDPLRSHLALHQALVSPVDRVAQLASLGLGVRRSREGSVRRPAQPLEPSVFRYLSGRTRLRLVLYGPGERPEDAFILPKARVDGRDDTVHVEVLHANVESLRDR